MKINEFRWKFHLSFFLALQWRDNELDGVSNTSLMIVYWTVYSDADQRKHQSSVSLAFVRGSPRWRMNSPHKGPVTRNLFPFDDVIMEAQQKMSDNGLVPDRRKAIIWINDNLVHWRIYELIAPFLAFDYYRSNNLKSDV